MSNTVACMTARHARNALNPMFYFVSILDKISQCIHVSETIRFPMSTSSKCSVDDLIGVLQ